MGPLDFTDWKWVIPTPGRWKDPDNEYRVLYFADDPVAAYVEALQNLRPEAEVVALLARVEDDADYDDPLPDVGQAIVEKLRDLRSSIYRPSGDDVVADLLAPDMKSALEAHPLVADVIAARFQRGARDSKRLKNGDMSAGDYRLTNAVSRAVYEATDDSDAPSFCGIVCPSAEKSGSLNYSLFETGRDSEVCRATLNVHMTLPALEETAPLRAALRYLELPDPPV